MQRKGRYYMAFPAATDMGIKSKFVPAISAAKVPAPVEVFVSRAMDPGGNLLKTKRGRWVISDARSGAFISEGETRARAIDWFRTFVLVKVASDVIEAKSRDMVSLYGLSPRYVEPS